MTGRMKRRLLPLYRWMVAFGIDLPKCRRALRNVPLYLRDLRKLKKQQASEAREFPFGRSYPCLHDREAASGSIQTQYFHQDLLVARRIHARNPDRHVDVGSRVNGFVAHVASFRSIEVLDLRPLPSGVVNIRSLQVNLMAPLQDDLVNYCDSLSCLHAMEHFGLGRYGDTVDADGYVKGIENLWRILKADGTLYFSVPIGTQRIEFNAHRVFSVGLLLQLFESRFRIDNFSFVDDHGIFHENSRLLETDIETNYGCELGCGILEMTKL